MGMCPKLATKNHSKMFSPHLSVFFSPALSIRMCIEHKCCSNNFVFKWWTTSIKNPITHLKKKKINTQRHSTLHLRSYLFIKRNNDPNCSIHTIFVFAREYKIKLPATMIYIVHYKMCTWSHVHLYILYWKP